MPQDDETYSVIYAALKHPVRRRILRMLAQEELTYTQMLTKLDLDTGHLNYYLESLGELLAKTPEGKYRLSEFGVAAFKLMSGVEEIEPAPRDSVKLRFSKRKITRLSQVLSIVALVLVGLLLMNVSFASSYVSDGSSGSRDIKDLQILQPYATLTQTASVRLTHFPVSTLTSHYQTFLQVEVLLVNVTLQVQVTESVSPMGSIPVGSSIERYVEDPVMVYNQTRQGPFFPEDEENAGSTGYTIHVPLQSPKEKGVLDANGYANYNVTITNLGREKIVREPSGNVHFITLPSNGSLIMKTSYLFIEKTDSPYFYYGLTLIVLAIMLAVLPYLPMLTRKTAKTIHRN
jgi:DNA-binding transcriptional ArsR family regulator